MADETTPIVDPTQEPTDAPEEGQGEVPESNSMRQLRENRDRLAAENAELKARVRDAAFRDAGFDPTQGDGKALAKLYEGDPNADAIRAFAETEFGWRPPTVRSEQEVAISAAQENTDAVLSQSVPTTPLGEENLAELILEAEKAGDFKTALSLKNIQLGNVISGKA